MRDFAKILDQLEAERGLVISYFAGFSRFEFALINSGLVVDIAKGNLHHATADWIGFAAQIESHFDYQRTDELGEAVDYLEKRPPKRLGVVDERA